MKVTKRQLRQIFQEERSAVLREQGAEGYRFLGDPQTFRSIEGGKYIYRTVAMIDTPQGPVAMYKSSGTGTPGGGAGGMKASVKTGAWTPYYGLVSQGHYSKGAWDANGNPINKAEVRRIMARGGAEGQNYHLKKAPANSLEGGVAKWLTSTEASSRVGLPSQQVFDIDSSKGLNAANEWFTKSSGGSTSVDSGTNKLRARSFEPGHPLARGGDMFNQNMLNQDGPALAQKPKFDGMTGKPLPNPRPPGAKFDGMTGKPIVSTEPAPAPRGSRRGRVSNRGMVAGPLGVAGLAAGVAQFPETESGQELETVRNLGLGAALGYGVSALGAWPVAVAGALGYAGSEAAPYIWSGASHIPGVGAEGGITPDEARARTSQTAQNIGTGLTDAYDTAASYVPFTRQWEQEKSRKGVDDELKRLQKKQDADQKVAATTKPTPTTPALATVKEARKGKNKMKITKRQLKQLIKEELSIKLLNERPADTAMYTPPREKVSAPYRGEVGFGDWDTMSFDDPKVAAAMSRVKNHLNKFVENGTFKKAAAESGVSERLIYGTVFDELMRSTPTTGAIEKVTQSFDDDPMAGTAMANITDWLPYFDRKEPAVGIASIKPRALFDLIDAGYLKDLNIPEKVRGGSTRAALDWIQNNPEASIQVVAARHKKKRDDWSNLKDSGRDVGYEPDEATLAQMYSMDDTPPQTRAQRAAINKDKGYTPDDKRWRAPDPTAGSRGKRVADIWGQMGYQPQWPDDVNSTMDDQYKDALIWAPDAEPAPEPRFSSIDETIERWKKLING